LNSAAHIAEAEPRARFVLYGQGSMRPEIEARIRKLGLETRITLAGVTQKPLKMMALMDVLLLTSEGEGVPNVLIEAQSVGIPVVSTRSGGAPEAIDADITGKIVDSSEAADLAKAVIDVLHDEKFRTNAAIAGPEFVRTKFAKERMIDSTILAYCMMEDYDTDKVKRGVS
jgi:glycosyltransferase involved in cell wall biosynthesis